ncbi:methyltransferase [Microtetraspora sp. NBRC 16547]|uniref:methyltransferase family protein n=1 Tax=Microtetraspora sp. NBRC 16547 TaxID=3030993 RepID=UPI0024A43713|nr:hypothetical protein Misp02_36710 [Microtetraspora sp. NBRC 16547]
MVGGLYRHVRNPMYLAVVTAIIGQALLLGRPELLEYGIIAGVVIWAFATYYEEPTLVRSFGTDYERYRAAAPGWWPRLRPWPG